MVLPQYVIVGTDLEHQRSEKLVPFLQFKEFLIMQIVLAKGLIQIIIYQRLVQLFVELSKKGDQCEGTTILT